MKAPNASGSALAPFFQKVEQLSKPQRIGIYAGTLIVILALVTGLKFWPQYKQIGIYKKQLVIVIKMTA